MPGVPTVCRCLFAIFLSTYTLAQNAPTNSAPIPPAPLAQTQSGTPAAGTADAELNALFQAKIKTEWDAFQNRDKKAYEALLDDDFEGVEVDSRGERNKIQAVYEVGGQNSFTYNLWGFKLYPLNPDAALVIYESTLQFAPGAQMRYLRVYISEVWVKRAGQWKELHYQETHVK
jgi:hypothetical protein